MSVHNLAAGFVSFETGVSGNAEKAKSKPQNAQNEVVKKEEYHGVVLDLSRDALLDEFSLSLLKQFYMKPDETSPQQSFARTALAYCDGDLEFAQRIYDYASKLWFMFASPVISNAPAPGQPWKALPISCYLMHVEDNLKSLIDHTSELRWLSVKGGGVGTNWSSVRSVSDKAPGPIPFLKCVDSDMLAFTQGTTRRASYAAYLDISHPDIIEFLEMRLPTGGDVNRKCMNLHNAVNITDAFMEACIEGKPWNLIDPHDKSVRETVDARELLQKIVDTRFRTGEPYLQFIDEANRQLPQAQKDKGLRINGSNLCNEIQLVTNNDRIAVCCLSSLNVELYNEWQDTTIVEDLIRFLDNVLQVFIDQCPPEMEKAKYSAMQERSLGLGALGFHAYLQRMNVPFESAMAVALNKMMFAEIKEKAVKSTEQLAIERGPYLDDPTGTRRNAHLLAIAPNANSSIIANTTPSIEPRKSNAYAHRMRAGTHLVKNMYLDRILVQRLSPGKLEKVWDSIILKQGSVQHLDCLDDHEKAVFKTAFEIDQKWIVQHAGDRQPYICQGQSVNLFFPAGSDKNDVMAAHIKAWRSKLKGLYYLRTTSGVDVNISQKVERVPLADYAKAEECLACQG